MISGFRRRKQNIFYVSRETGRPTDRFPLAQSAGKLIIRGILLETGGKRGLSVAVVFRMHARAERPQFPPRMQRKPGSGTHAAVFSAKRKSEVSPLFLWSRCR